MVDLPGSLQAKRIEGGRSVRSFVLPSFVRSWLVRSLGARWSGLKSGMPLCQISSLEEMDGSLTGWLEDTAAEMSFQ